MNVFRQIISTALACRVFGNLYARNSLVSIGMSKIICIGSSMCRIENSECKVQKRQLNEKRISTAWCVLLNLLKAVTKTKARIKNKRAKERWSHD